MQSPSLSLVYIIAHLCANEDNALVLVRHGNTAKAPVDEARQLTDKGIAQAAATREYLANNHPVIMVVSSSAQRALTTVADARWSAPISLPALYVSPEGAEEEAVVDEAFKRLLYVPLSTYFAEAAVEAALMQWAERAVLALEEAFREQNPGDGTVVIGGHAVLLNSLAIVIAKATDPDADVSVALEAALGEAECIEIRVVQGAVRMRHLDTKTLGHPVTT